MSHNPIDFPEHYLLGCPKETQYIETTSLIYDSTNPLLVVGVETTIIEQIINSGATSLDFDKDSIVINETVRGIKDRDEYDYFNDTGIHPANKHISKVHITCQYYLCQKYWTVDYDQYMKCPIIECPECGYKHISAEWVKYQALGKNLDLVNYQEQHPNQYDHFEFNEWPSDNDLHVYKLNNPESDLDLYAYNTSYNYIYQALYFIRNQFKRTVY